MEIKDIHLVAITQPQLKSWTESYALRATGLNHLRFLSSVLSWCKLQGYITVNPAKGLAMDPVTPTPRRIQLMRNDRVQHLINQAAVIKEGVVMPYLVLTTWGALRPEEAIMVEPDDISLDADEPLVRLIHTKTRLQRVVELSENAAAMLRYYWKGGPIRVKNMISILGQVKEASGIIDGCCPKTKRTVKRDGMIKWIKDVLRKIGLSQKYAATNDLLETTRWGGNSPDMFHEHYKGLVTRKEAIEFWSMLPESMPRDPELLKRINEQLKVWKALKYSGDNPPVCPYVAPQPIANVAVIAKINGYTNEEVYG